jgi:hypothetical protein
MKKIASDARNASARRMDAAMQTMVHGEILEQRIEQPGGGASEQLPMQA